MTPRKDSKQNKTKQKDKESKEERVSLGCNSNNQVCESRLIGRVEEEGSGDEGGVSKESEILLWDSLVGCL